MGLNLTLAYPGWFILLCLLAGAVYAVALYYQNREYEFSRTLNIILGLIRFTIIAFLAFFLLNPLITSNKKYSEKPIILFAQDNSASITLGKDSLYFQQEYKSSILDFIDNLKDSYEVKEFSFGEELQNNVPFDFSENLTNFSSALEELRDRYGYKNIGALVIASDGIYNRGMNPVYSSSGLNFPIYTIALGDTTIRRDIVLKKLNFNRLAYLGNEFPLEIMVSAQKSSGTSTRLTVRKGDNILFSKTLGINTDNFITTENVLLNATVKGLQKYTVELSPVENEISIANNIQDIYIDILDGKQKVLMLSQSPHPDITAIKQALLSNKNYEFEDFIIDDFDKPVSGYNLVILHGLPSLRNNISQILEKVRSEKIPVLYIITQQTFLNLFNDQLAGVSIRAENLIYNEAQPQFNEFFSLFTLDEATLRLLANASPLISPYGMITLQPSATPVLYQKIGSVKTQEPQFILNESTNNKSGVILGEGIWKWRLKSWANDGTHKAFDDFINKTVQYLSLKVDKRFFKVLHKNNFEENENIDLDAQVYNDIYEPINDPEVKIVIRDEFGNEFPFLFNRTASAYHLSAGKLKSGNYTYEASVQTGDKFLTDKGEFTISPLNIELTNTVADHNLLFNLSQNRGGEMFFPDQLNALRDKILERDDIRTVTYRQKQYSEILNIPWLLALLLLLTSIEWFIRKRSGGY